MAEGGASRERCLVPDCERPQELSRGRPINGLCAGHRRRKYLGLSNWDAPLDETRSRRLSQVQLLDIAGIELGNAGDNDGEYEKRRHRLHMRAVRYTISLGYRRPGRVVRTKKPRRRSR